ncbi:hypothetical protein COL26b_014413 [Colletotrichum chrysophilum]|uniref:uncharacterized protein n=1 Tax=Colletotrichum chrysophilum TaxID=1836956 RepID=UPI002300587C|nr:uncharacterized protein COL26b_014413 [Colletotrichum chrysophilum]KAJ0359094.1 hypothetical protein COL26b_014413 [Colletotrichum chrysophilum]
MSVRNATNGVTTIVTPSGAQYAGNINDKLLPPPVPVTCTIGSSPRMIDGITRSCWPQNAACGSPIICRNCPPALTNCNRVNRRRRCLSNSSSAAVVVVRRRLVGAPPPRSSAPNPNNRCHCRLTARNLSRNAAVLNGLQIQYAILDPDIVVVVIVVVVVSVVCPPERLVQIPVGDGDGHVPPPADVDLAAD